MRPSRSMTVGARWTHRHLLGIEELSRTEATLILDAADAALAPPREPVRAPVQKRDTLKGKTVVNLFFEASTRTRSSFELAGKRLAADVINVSASASSVTKGETLLDTVRNLEAMRTDVIVLRHPAAGSARFVAGRTRSSVVNAGDGAHEHPTQALLDALTIRRHKGKVEGLTVAICGDILHSRVARSNALLLGKLGAKVNLAAPRTLMPRDPEGLGATVTPFERLEDALVGADVVMMLRIQTERLAGVMMATTREYSRFFGLNAKQLSLAQPDAVVMHPGPINRGVEIDGATADGGASLILDQVEAGVAVRAAVLELVTGAHALSDAADAANATDGLRAEAE